MTFSRLLPVLGALCLTATPALAGPLDDGHVGSLGFSGPTTSDVTALYWNPAALGLIQDYQLIVAGSLQIASATVQRSAIDANSGAPGGSSGFPSASGRGVRHPLAWPPGPGGFVGVGASIGRRFAIAVGAYAPFAQRMTFDASATGDQPLRYHLVRVDTQETALVTGLAIHAAESLQLGAAMGFLLSSGHLVFDENTSLGAENSATAARYDLASDGVQRVSPFVSGGIHYRRGRLDVGLSYTTAPLGTSGAVHLPIERSQLALQQGSVCSSPNDRCLTGQIEYKLPGYLIGGATWHASPRLSVTGILRWLRYGSHDRLSMRVVGPTGTALGTTTPDTIALYRGFQDSWDLRARVIYAVSPWLRLSGTMRGETSAVPAANLNAGAIDGLKFEPSLAVELSLWGRVRLEAGYALAWMRPSSGGETFDPTAAAACAQAAGDLSTPACRQRLAGTARPSAAGRYELVQHTLAVLTKVSF